MSVSVANSFTLFVGRLKYDNREWDVYGAVDYHFEQLGQDEYIDPETIIFIIFVFICRDFEHGGQYTKQNRERTEVRTRS